MLAVAFIASFLAFRGLYGLVPFLLSLGWSAVLAFSTLTAWRLIKRQDLSLRRRPLKRQGRLTAAGYAYLALCGVIGLLWVHSGWIRYHQYRGESAFGKLDSLRHQSLDMDREMPTPTQDQWRLLRSSRHHLQTVERWGLLPTPGSAWRLAWLSFLSGAPVELDDSARLAVARGEDPAQMHHLLALAALQADDRETARRQFELAIEAAPERPGPFLDYGLLEVDSGDLAAASEIFERGLEAAVTSAEVAYNAGLAKALSGDLEAAIERFGRALELDPEHLPARENLAGVLASAGRYAESEKHYRLAIRQSPDDAGTRLLLARVLAARGDFAGAREELERCLQLAPEFEEAIILARELDARR